jgi:aromatase
MSSEIRDTEHGRVVLAPAERLYELVADVSRWPAILGPCIYAERVEEIGDAERIAIWASANGAVKSWTSRRVLDPVGLRVTFEQERTAAPIAAMSGTWSFVPEGKDRTRLVLGHSFAADTPGIDALDWISQAVDRNSVQELAALAAVAELGLPLDGLVFHFGERVELPGVTAAEVYEFVDRADRWPDSLPHVRSVDLREETAGVQQLEMETVTPDGSSHTTSSIRLCFPHARIAYKQTVLPELLSGHSGVWEFEDIENGAAITSRHTAALEPSTIGRVLGAGTTFAQARAHVRTALKANSRKTMEAAGKRAALSSPGDGRG